MEAVGDEVHDSSVESDGGKSNIMKPNVTGASFQDSLSVLEAEILLYEKDTSSKLPGDFKVASMMDET